MEASVEKISNLERQIKVAIPAEDIDKKALQELEKSRSKVKLGGFRPGKVPLEVVKQRFGKSVRQDIVANTIKETYFEVLKKENLRPAGPPEIKPSQSEFGEPLEYLATLEILPEINLVSMDGVKIEKLTSEVTDHDVENMVQKLLKQYAEWHEIDREAQKGDQLVIDFEGKLKGETFKGGSAKDYKFELGAGMMLDDFEQPLQGSKVGAVVNFKVKFPKDYSDSNVAGKKAEFEVKVHKILASKLPELNDEFLTKVGIKEGGEQALRTELRKNMEQQLDQATIAQFKKKLIDKLLELNPVELPKVMIENEIQRLQHQMQQQFAQYAGGSTKDLPQPPREEFIEPAKRRVNLGLISNKIVEEQKIEPDPKRVKDKIESLAANYDQPEEVVNWYYKNKEHLLEVESLVLEEQVMEELQEQVKVGEKKVSFDEIINPNQDNN